MNTSKFEWRTFRTIPHKAVCSRKTYRVDGWNKDIVLKQIDEYLRSAPHTCSCQETSLSWNVFEIEVVILVEGTIRKQQEQTEYIRTAIDNIILSFLNKRKEEEKFA